MTSFDRFDPFERRIGAALDGLAPPRRLDYLDDVFRQTARTAQRPRWSFPERWLPMDAVASAPFVRTHLIRVVLVLLALALAVIGLAVVGTSPPVERPVLGVFSRTGELNPENGLVYTLRTRDGSVLISNGRSVQRFDPASGRFATLPNVEFQIRGWLESQDGGLLTLHVEDDTEPGSEGHSWIVATRLPPPGSAGAPETLAESDPFYLQAAVALPDGRFVILGQDFGMETLVALIFDPTTRIFTRAGSTPRIVNGEHATLLADGRILVIDQPMDSPEMNLAIYDVARRSFTPLPSLAFAAKFSTTPLRDGRILIAGGGVAPVTGPAELSERAYLVDPEAGDVARLEMPGEARWMHAAALLADGRVLIAGGSLQSDLGSPTRTTLYFDPSTMTFTPGPGMLDARMNATAVQLADGRILFFGHSTLVQSPESPASGTSEVFH
jgi:hypothetical protein